jgi:hypothetical protein
MRLLALCLLTACSVSPRSSPEAAPRPAAPVQVATPAGDDLGRVLAIARACATARSAAADDFPRLMRGPGGWIVRYFGAGPDRHDLDLAIDTAAGTCDGRPVAGTFVSSGVSATALFQHALACAAAPPYASKGAGGSALVPARAMLEVVRDQYRIDIPEAVAESVPSGVELMVRPDRTDCGAVPRE